ncbi:MAG: sulfotransferase [Chloroflexi bacterium]|nr:sulfotransferase [Chloroflexota bacterium]MCC6565566.1 sulfotransferase [Chloroflexota bacterium]MDL1915435.1 sulfotransferase [Anaerolineae bacterium CFX4]MEB2366786.1 sulfotransferase [Chloroflexota bacterium]
MRDFRLLYVSGASGSGTTLLAQILAAAPQVVTVAGKHRTLSREKDPAFRLAKRINWTTRDLWDRHGDVSLYAQARQALPRLVQELLQYEQHAATTHLVIKRSSPFYRGDRYRPDMQDIVDLFPNSRILVIYRDPRAATYSSFRRGFAPNLHNMAVVCEEHLTLLSAQLQALDAGSYMAFRYETWMQHAQAVTRDVAAFAGLPEQVLLDATERKRLDSSKNDQWRNELSPEDAAFLDTFFNEKRTRRWGFLESVSQ